MDKTRLENYAKLIVKSGLNVQEGQEVLIQCGLDQPDFVTLVAEECYKAGAKRVTVKWSHMPVSKVNYTYRTLETLSEFTDIERAEWQNRVDKLPCLLWLDSDDPDGLAGTDSAKIAAANMARFPSIKPFRDAIENKYQWCIAAVPGKEWAKKIFPDLEADEAIEKLWDAILNCSRVTDDPIAEWDKHNKNLAKRCRFLNDYRFDRLEYKSSNGTDFTVGLNEKGIFCGGGETTLGANIYFNPNIPSEEVFTSPMRGRAEGKVVSTKPLSYQGKLIENFWVEFKDGKVVKVGAEKNQDVLEKMVAMDEGASYLGEVALIAYDSPINKTGILFYNTLFDENASCHLAFGQAYPTTIRGGNELTEHELEARGANRSVEHVDFMVGAKDLRIVGIAEDGNETELFSEGDWIV